MRVYLFDIDGTLLSSGGAGKAAMEAALRATFDWPHGADPVSFAGRTDRAIGRDLFAHVGVADTPEVWQQFLTAYLDALPDALASHRGRVLPGVAAFLDHLSEQPDTLIGLLTGNTRRGAERKLAHYGLWDRFGFGGFGDVHLDRDDVAREAFEAARTLSPREPAAVWVIGDTPLDVRCARAIGAKACAVATGWHSLDELAASRPDVLLTDLSDYSPLI